MGDMNMDRRTFVEAMGALGALSLAGASLGAHPTVAVAAETAFPEPGTGKPIEARIDPKTGDVTVNEDVIVRYSGCVGCYSSCGNRVKLDRATGRVLGVGGNPYNPACAYPYLNHEEPLEEAYRSMSYANGKGNMLNGTVCGRGNGTLDAVSQPDRITVPLKRAGKRGEGKWKPIGWDQLIKEVTEGGKLFADIGEDRDIEGFKALCDTSTPMNPEQPDLGPVSNQLVMLGGRADGRGAFSSRFAASFGTLNQYGHVSSCAGANGAGSLLQESVNTMMPDPEEAEYALWFGGFPGASGINFQSSAKRTTKNLAAGKLKIDVIDPTLANGAVTPTMPGINWVPIKPATNGAFASALTRSIIDGNRHNARFLAFPNQEAAVAGGYASHTNASYLVIVDEGHPNYRKLMRAADAGIEAPEVKDKAGKPVEQYVVVDESTGEPALHSQCSQGVLEYEGEVNGVKVRTGFLLLKETVSAYTMDEYADITGISVDELERIAKEYTSHGVKTSIWANGGSCIAVNGLDASMGTVVLRALIGSNQMTGGNVPYSMTPVAMGNGARYKLNDIEGKPDVSAKNATAIARTGKAWEGMAEYANRVAAGEKAPKPTLPWYPNAPLSDAQTLMSIVNRYPYQAKILTTWMNNVLQATPGAMRDEVIDRFKDPAYVPLHIACDLVIGEGTQYADYVVPDVSQYESFGIPQVGTAFTGYGSTVRWQVKEPESIQLDDGRHASWEAFLADVAKACELPGWGEGAIKDVDGKAWPLDDAVDYYLKAVANLAYGETPVEDISPEEARLQGLDELPPAFAGAVSAEEWPKVQSVLSRGGRYWPMSFIFGDDGRSRWYEDNYRAFVYSEKRALAKNCYSGERLPGTLHYRPQTFSDLSPMTERFSTDEFPFTASEHKPRFRSVSMLANSPIMRDLCDHNYIEINEEDAAALGIADGDAVKITNPIGDVSTGEAMVRAGQVKGAFSSSFGYGHRAYGAQDVEVDGTLTKGNPAIAAGVYVTTMLDPTVTTDGVLGIIADNDASCPGRSGGMFKIEKA